MAEKRAPLFGWAEVRLEAHDPPPAGVLVEIEVEDGDSSLVVPAFRIGTRQWGARVAARHPGPLHMSARSDPPVEGIEGVQSTFDVVEPSEETSLSRHGPVVVNSASDRF